ncbi:MAG: acyl-coenzyme A thioesterase PaaI-like protein [Myxococcota bacterium]|jgi:acyl-coenzyme A thioesterase PaaI-like protein
MSKVDFVVGTQPPDALVNLSASVRGLAAKLVRIDTGDDELVAARAEVDAITQRLDAIARKGSDPRVIASMEPGPEDLRPYYPASALTWNANPIFPPLAVEVEGTLVRGSMNLDLAYEGPPGCVHGGVISMIFDQLLGHANAVNETWGMTVELNVAYAKPTPLFAPLEFLAQVTRVDGRKITTEGSITHNGELTAKAVGLFVAPAFETGTSLPNATEQYQDRMREHGPGPKAAGPADDA